MHNVHLDVYSSYINPFWAMRAWSDHAENCFIDYLSGLVNLVENLNVSKIRVQIQYRVLGGFLQTKGLAMLGDPEPEREL